MIWILVMTLLYGSPDEVKRELGPFASEQLCHEMAARLIMLMQEATKAECISRFDI